MDHEKRARDPNDPLIKAARDIIPLPDDEEVLSTFMWYRMPE